MDKDEEKYRYDEDGIITHIKVNDTFYSIEKFMQGKGYERYLKANEKVRTAFVLIAEMDLIQLDASMKKLDLMRKRHEAKQTI